MLTFCFTVSSHATLPDCEAWPALILHTRSTMMSCTLAQYRSSIGCYCGGIIGASLFCDFMKIKHKVHVNLNKTGISLMYTALLISWIIPVLLFTSICNISILHSYLYIVVCTYVMVKIWYGFVPVNVLPLLVGMRFLYYC